MKRILIVDDEADLREIIACNLESAGYAVEEAGSAEEALALIRFRQNDEAPDTPGLPALILLDVMMPGINGFQMADILRRERHLNIPIIFLTAKDHEEDILTGFARGGDDYITKPFSVRELMARVAAVVRRAETAPTVADDKTSLPQQRDLGGGLLIDDSQKVVIVNGAEVILSRKEMGILTTLASQPGHVFTRDDILSAVWNGEAYVLDRTVDVHIARLRKKLGQHGERITSRQGYGYKFD
ncbi:MAG: response regulator transcription factor [Alloprevotella sp.]